MASPSIDWPQLFREFRKQRGFKQEAAAAYLGVSQASISRWESGVSLPTVAMRNRLFAELRRGNFPFEMSEWMKTFRRLPFPGAIISADRVAHAVTEFLAAQIGAPPTELEGLGIAQLFEGQVLDLAEEVREQGGFSGYLASVEACVRLEISRQIRPSMGFNAHLLNWPHFCENGEIVRINQGVFLTDDQADQVRERLAGSIRFNRLD